MLYAHLKVMQYLATGGASRNLEMKITPHSEISRSPLYNFTSCTAVLPQHPLPPLPV
jgi:hypothetical protein